MTETERLDHRRRLCSIDAPTAGLPEPVAYMNVKTGAVKSLAALQRDPEPGVWHPFNLQAQLAPLIGVCFTVPLAQRSAPQPPVATSSVIDSTVSGNG